MTGSSWRGGSVVVASRDWNLATSRSPVRADAAGERIVALGRGVEGVEHRLVARVDLGVARDPCPQRRPALDVGRERVERLGRRAQLAGDLPRQVAEHVLLARRSTGRRTPASSRRAWRSGRRCTGGSPPRRSPQRGVEDALLRPLPAGPDLRVVGERRAAHDRPGRLEVGDAAVVDAGPGGRTFGVSSARCHRPESILLQKSTLVLVRRRAVR